jgi:cytochrome c556
MTMRTVSLALAGALLIAGLGVASFAQAQSMTPAQAIEARQKAMKEIGASSRAINEGQKAVADHPKVVAAATVINGHAKTLSTLFPAGSDMTNTAVKNFAKPEIWANKADFDMLAKNLETASADMIRIAAGTDNAAVQDQFKKIGASCGACHQKYRAPAQ